LRAIKSEFEQSRNQVEWTFVGKVSEQVQAFVQSDPWMKSRIHFAGYVSHREVFGFYAKADLLVLILTDTKNAQGNIPGKLFEYLATGVSILALGDPNGDSSRILRDAGAGEVLSHTDESGIRRKLSTLINSSPSNGNPSDLEKYSRKNLSNQLAKILDEHSLS
jgi:glycosyltransferase involved in cell wall biosynthesis